MTTQAPRRRRGWLLVLGLLFVLGGSWAVIFFSDPPPPDASDLLPPPRLEIPDAENSYFAWEEAVQKVSETKPLREWDNPGKWTWNSAPPYPHVVRERAPAPRESFGLEPLVAALELPEFAPPRNAGVPHHLFPCFEALEKAVFISTAQGKWSEAWEWSEISNEWARRFHSHPLHAVPIVLSMGVRRIGDARLRLAQGMPNDPLLLASCLATTERSRLAADWRERTLRQQFEYLKSEFETDAYFKKSRTVPPPSWAIRLFRPHRTQRKLAAWTRLALEESAAGRDPGPRLEEERDPGGRVRQVLEKITGNAGGEWALRRMFVLPDEVIGVKQVRTLEVAEAMTRTILALRIYRLEHGTWPVTLEELTPEIIETLPADPHDSTRAPLRYDREREVVWSVGADGRDDGGVLPDEVREFLWLEGANDLVAPLRFEGTPAEDEGKR